MLSGLRVLIVEDVATIRTLTRELLELEGAVVMEASTGRRAVEVLREYDVDVVLTDLGLPDVPGAVVITYVRVAFEGRTPVAVLSGSSPQDLARARKLGAAQVFSKPVEWGELVEYLARCAAAVPVDRRHSPWNRRPTSPCS